MRHRQTISLGKSWTAWSFNEPGTRPRYSPPDKATETFAFDLPMDVRTMLARAGKTPDPRVGRNSLDSDWIVGHEWWFQKMFTAPALPGRLRVYLRTAGLDHLADLYVNRQPIGSTESFNQVHYFDITKLLRPTGENELAIRLLSCDPSDLEDAKAVAEGKKPVRSSDLTLKSIMFSGGDHNPFLYNAGIAHAPEIIVGDGAMMKFVTLQYAFEDLTDIVRGHVEIHADVWNETPVEIKVAPIGFQGETHGAQGVLTPGQSIHRIPFTHRPVKRWMPFQLGTPHCYQMTVKAGEQEISGVVGFRSVEKRENRYFKERPVASILDWHPYENNGPFGQEYYKGYDAIHEAGEAWPATPREGNYDYQHVVNNTPFFVMGGSVVPPTLFWSDWSGEHLRELVRRAVESNNNTLRIWGGGYLIGEEFFEEASLRGLMISHDFFNFQTQSKGSLSYQKKKEAEFRNIVRQLNPHPSVVIFNGGNELYQIRDHRPLDPLFAIMDRVMNDETTTQLFHRSCPVNPEVHGPWLFDLDHASRYNSFKTIFNSECGCQGAPNLESLQKAMSNEELSDVFGTAWLHRMMDPGYFACLMSYSELFGPARQQTPENVVKQSQLVQAMAYQYIAEEFRRQKPYTSGFTTWEFNEPWIDMNWGIIDSDLVRKASFETFKRACAVHLVSLRFGSYVWAEGAEFAGELWLCSESQGLVAVAGEISVDDAAGKTIWSQKFSGQTRWISTRVQGVRFTVPSAGKFTVRIKSISNDGMPLVNEYPFVALSRVSGESKRILYVGGDAYEANTTFQYFRAAGFEIDLYRVDTPYVRDVHKETARQLPDFSKYAAVVIGPMFNPISTLGEAFYTALDKAVRAGLGLAYFGYNTSAYVSGRYTVDELRGSVLENLLPVTFTRDHYGNSEDARETGPMQQAGEHVIFKGINMEQSPGLGLRVGCIARSGATLIAKAKDGEAVIAEAMLGSGRVVVCTAPFGGHNFQEPQFRGWSYANHLLTNIVEYAATGTTADRNRSPHPFAPLL